MSSTIGIKKIQYPNGTNAITIASDGTLTTDSDFTISGELTVSPSNTSNNIATIKTGSLEARLDFVANRANKSNQAMRFAVDSDEKAAFSITAGTDLLARSEGGATQQLDLRQGSAKQWVNIDASTSTPSVQNSYNVASLTDVATGLFDYNTTNNFSSAKFSGGGSHDVYSARAGAIESSDDRGNNTSRVRTRVNNSSGSSFDSREIMFTTHGDMA